jgi:hypothetical protein
MVGSDLLNDFMVTNCGDRGVLGRAWIFTDFFTIAAAALTRQSILSPDAI